LFSLRTTTQSARARACEGVRASARARVC
jgi:hypothetical protein